MIRITYTTSNSETHVHRFEEEFLSIGSDKEASQLIIPTENLKPRHVTISKQDSFFIIHNVHSDPLVSLNGQHFTKKFIHHGDVILINQTQLLFEIISSSTNEPNQKRVHSTLKDEHQNDLEIEMNEGRPQDHDPSVYAIDDTDHLYQAWKWILVFIGSLFSIFGIVATIIYFNVSDKTEAQEIKAARATADIAMAIVYAQTHGIKPNNRNWADRDFLKENLMQLLEDQESLQSEIDSQGKFKFIPYSLRIYTNYDLSHFLIIAQPAPSVLQWLIPKSLILLDSYTMELRTLKDTKTLNRLLAAQDPFEGTHEKELIQAIKEGEKISLKNLVSAAQYHDFKIPETLYLKKSESAEKIYNAPRYHRLGKSLIDNASSFLNSKASADEMHLFKQQIQALAHLKDLVLYANDGEDGAERVKESISIFNQIREIHNSPFLFGYLNFSQEKKIIGATLLNDKKDVDELALSDTAFLDKNRIAVNSQDEQEFSRLTTETINSSLVDDPLYTKLVSLIHQRQQKIESSYKQLHTLLANNSIKPMIDFESKINEALAQYLSINDFENRWIEQQIALLYEEYRDVPIEQFLDLLQKCGLDQFIKKKQGTFSFSDENCKQQLTTMIMHVESAKNLTDLHNFIEVACSWLSFEYIDNSDELQKYQQNLRNALLVQLEKHLLLPREKLDTQDHFTIKDKEALEKILSNERLIMPEEARFFRHEMNVSGRA